MRRISIQKVLGGIAIALVLLAAASPALAFDAQAGDQVVIAAGEVVEDDLYVGADTFTLHGTIKGDLVVGANKVIIASDGVVEGDLWAGGQSVTVEGTVAGDVRITGMALTIGESAQIKEDLLAAAYSLETKAGSQVAERLWYAGAQGILAGHVAGNADVAASGLELLGTIDGNLKVEVSNAEDMPPVDPFRSIPNMPAIPTVAGGLTLGPSAKVGGEVEVYSPKQIAVPASVAPAEKVRWFERRADVQINRNIEEAQVTYRNPLWEGFLAHLRQFVALLLIGLVLALVAPRFLRSSVNQVQSNPLPSLGWGFVSAFIVLFVLLVIFLVMLLLAFVFGLVTLGNLAAVVVLVSLIAMLALVFGFVLAAWAFSVIVVSALVGRWVLERVQPAWAESRIGPLVVGLVLFALAYGVLSLPPVIGGILGFVFYSVVMWFGLGGMWLAGRQALQPKPVVP